MHVRRSRHRTKNEATYPLSHKTVRCVCHDPKEISDHQRQLAFPLLNHQANSRYRQNATNVDQLAPRHHTKPHPSIEPKGVEILLQCSESSQSSLSSVTLPLIAGVERTGGGIGGPPTILGTYPKTTETASHARKRLASTIVFGSDPKDSRPIRFLHLIPRKH